MITIMEAICYLMIFQYLLIQDVTCIHQNSMENMTKKRKKYVGKDIFTDYINVSSIASYYDTKFQEYDITHVITKKSSKLKMLISRDKKYKEIYSDNNFVIYERNGNDK